MNRSRAQELLSGAAGRASALASYLTIAQLHRRRAFTLEGRRYSYDAHLYNKTWSNERAVELPIVTREILAKPRARILELGNVLAHYGVRGHTVVDKYEQSPGVLNLDIVDFRDDQRFDLIISVSTLEHIGFEEEIADPLKPARVMRHLAELLAPNGKAVVTFPLGYNPALDDLVRKQPQIFGRVVFLTRSSEDNRWVEADLAALDGVQYGSPYPSANAIGVSTVHAPHA